MDDLWRDAWTEETREPLMIIRHPPDGETDPPGGVERPHVDRHGMIEIRYPTDTCEETKDG